MNEAFFGMPIVTSRYVPVGQFYITDRTIFTNLTVDQLQIKLWVADALKVARAHLARLVADAERRLGFDLKETE